MYEANLYQVASALESMPRVLEGAELEAFAGKMKDTAICCPFCNLVGVSICIGLKHHYNKDRFEWSDRFSLGPWTAPGQVFEG